VRSHHYLEDIALSDLAFEASGATAEEMFGAAAQALFEAMADTRQVRPRVEQRIALKATSLDRLLFDWLSELVYLKDAKGLLFSKFDITLKGDCELVARVWGELIDPKRHNLYLDVKAVTYHLFEITKREEQWTARIVLDI
jgi:SHS2 domain-containing protein